MPTNTKVLGLVVLLCLLLPLAAGGQRPRPGKHHGCSRHRLTMRLRRCGTNRPTHQPTRPAPAAVLPPDEDDDSDRLRHAAEPLHAAAPILPESPLLLPFSRRSAANPPAPDRPLYQTLCLLLI